MSDNRNSVSGMSWNHGEAVSPGGMDQAAGQASGLGSVRSSPLTPVQPFSPGLSSAALATTSRTGSHMNTDDLFGTSLFGRK